MKTVLYEEHCRLGGKLVDFNGWSMPLYYTGIIQEHQIVRTKAGLFDVSHMGYITVEGEEAEKFLDYLAVNEISGKKNNSSVYTVLAAKSGGSIDDVLIFKEDTEHFFLIVNAGNRDKDLAHLLEYAKKYRVSVKDHYDDCGILALQGPETFPILRGLFPEADGLKPFRFIKSEFSGKEIIISHTGYTGEKGVEIIAPLAVIPELWSRILAAGETFGIQPVGLGARDTLRLEMGYALYSHELSADIPPNESVSAWTVKFDKEDFLGKEALLALENSPVKLYAYGVILEDPGIAREGYEVFSSDQWIGYVTSGTNSPTLHKSIALIVATEKLAVDDIVHIKIRNDFKKARITKIPFYHPEKHKEIV